MRRRLIEMIFKGDDDREAEKHVAKLRDKSARVLRSADQVLSPKTGGPADRVEKDFMQWEASTRRR